MLIRANSLSEVTKTRLMNGASLPDFLGAMEGEKSPSTQFIKQNAYENVFIKLFAQSMLYLITIFGLLYSGVSVVRELLGKLHWFECKALIS